MSVNPVVSYLVFANLQMAAEANLLGQNGQPVSGGDLVNALIKGNDRSSKFPTVLAEQFKNEWTVVAQQSNTPTGFSGTLFEYKGADDPARGLIHGQQVLSFRSTEFIDDAVRDNQATNGMELNKFGWAFGQIGDMQNWFESLRNDGKVNGPVTVTGYSLGGHLATAFNLRFCNTSVVACTHTFYGAGVGATAGCGNPASVRLCSHFCLQRRMNTGGWQRGAVSKPLRKQLHAAIR
jgi:hypothetical protein